MTRWWRNFFFSFLLGRFSENLRRKWRSEIVNVIVKRQLDSNFHGLYSYRPKKWRKNVQNFAVKPVACGDIVVLLEFWTYWRHSMVDKSTAHGKIIVVDFSSRFWYVQHYMAGKPNQSCHKFVEYVLKGWKKNIFLSGSCCSTILSTVHMSRVFDRNSYRQPAFFDGKSHASLRFWN